MNNANGHSQYIGAERKAGRLLVLPAFFPAPTCLYLNRNPDIVTKCII
jgi:hypothetical protein